MIRSSCLIRILFRPKNRINIDKSADIYYLCFYYKITISIILNKVVSATLRGVVSVTLSVVEMCLVPDAIE
jgi:hypothetical protein